MAAAVARHGWPTLRLARRAINEYGALQRTWELMSLVGAVRRLVPRTVVEIGTHRGGTLFCWAAAAHPAAHLVSIDIPNPAEGMGATGADDARLRRVLGPAQSLTCLRSDSHAPETRAALVRALAGRAVDFLWIDGDHSYQGVRSDFEMYAPLVRPGGLIAFHDILPNPALPGNQVRPFWDEVRQGFEHSELVDQDHPGGVGMGIGILVQRAPASPPGA
ncbi:MAG TPA: class I SAM-dependent methyltransferase [Longimicrobiaceae bacterium]|nr:class I SAM-dependent methyltransferase [Longimicrobiaceae bacterium]